MDFCVCHCYTVNTNLYLFSPFFYLNIQLIRRSKYNFTKQHAGFHSEKTYAFLLYFFTIQYKYICIMLTLHESLCHLLKTQIMELIDYINNSLGRRWKINGKRTACFSCFLCIGSTPPPPQPHLDKLLPATLIEERLRMRKDGNKYGYLT